MIKKIGSFAYTNLNYIKIPKQVTEIYQNAFSFCENLQLVIFEDNSDLIIIGEYAFQNTPIEFMNSDNFIIGKTDPNCEYDELVLVLDNFIDDLTIPQFIKKIDDFCFH